MQRMPAFSAERWVAEGYVERTLRHKRRAENFPVAMRLLPRQVRADLLAIYAVARTVDDLGDAAAGDRTALLEAFAADLARIWDGAEPAHPVVRGLVPTVRRHALAAAPFEHLIQANLQDQRVTRYHDFRELLGYCTRSANPVGRLVLTVFGVRDPRLEELSDRVCTALQLIEHWQDVAEDYRAGRVYLPQVDLTMFGVPESDLGRPTASRGLRRLLTFEVNRAAVLLDSGRALVPRLRGWARLAVAGYVAGGLATIDALRRPGADPLAAPVSGRRRDLLRHLIALLLPRRTWRTG